MPVPEACLRTRRLLTAHRRAPFLLTRVGSRRGVITIPPSIPPRATTPSTVAAGAKSKWDRHDRGVALFRNVVEGAQEGDEGASYSAAERIAEVTFLLKSGQMTPGRAWAVLKGEVVPGIKPGEDVAPAVRTLLEVLMGARREGAKRPEDMPSSAELARMYLDVGRGRNLRPLVRLMTATLETIYKEAATRGEEETRAMVEDVVGLWVAIFTSTGKSAARHPARIQLPSLKSPKIQQLIRRPDPFASVIRATMPHIPPTQLTGMTAALLTTFVLIEDAGLRSSETAKPLAPLLTFTEQLMGYVWARPDEEALREFDGQSETLRAYVTPRLHIHRHLSRGFRSRDPDSIRQTWASLSAQIEADDDSGALEGDPGRRRRYAELLDYCVFIWCALGRGDIDAVLGFMGRRGFGYTLRTYTSMMEGWKQARKPRNIELLWTRLAQDGVPLDSVIWSARISALMTCGLEKPAVRALFEMGQFWDDAAKAGGKAPTGRPPPVKPDIGPVNAALTGVLRSKGVKAAPPILAWAAKYDIEPDIVTYNMLLRSMLREGLAAESDALLREMNTRGVAADAATFTIIVEEVLGAAADEGEERKVEAVRGIFAAIEASGQKAKGATYAKMIHVLLGRPSGESSSQPPATPDPAREGGEPSGAAVRAVLAHMRRSGLHPSSHIFTIIADHHLSRGDVSAVREMISSWGLGGGPGADRVDGVFWEVVVRGYARAGLASEAKAVFFSLRRETRVTLSVLDQLLVALLEEGDTEGARELVRAVRERMGGPAGGGGGGVEGDEERERYMKHHFWHVVAENGLDVDQI
ncbi:uncharacterized protein DNG_07229 [Cephalotrichum gorgonifer]|uniref:Uncharacterized protein n=1 Tax=Cephalotrichum gorgonifer TaxID=2041049 RepID=A0AAE8SXA8_9PEZI|nr:uncharacterized protein DNG_07229 [Cephalotrichum gorgonifer]